jgi:glycosyltransferase involved in cell wall biosynthesis
MIVSLEGTPTRHSPDPARPGTPPTGADRNGPFRLAYVVSHPIQYQAPLLRRLAREPGLALKVFFLTDAGAQPFHDPGFDRVVKWDVPLLEGYDHQFVARGLPLPLGFNQPARFSWRRAFAAGGFHAVWLNGYAHVPLLRAFAAAKWLGMSVLVRGESHDGLRRVEPRWRRAAQRALFRRVDAFLAIGSANRDFYLARGAAPERVHLAPYSVDNQYFRDGIAAAAARRAALLSELGLSPSLPIVLFASKLQPRKRCRDLLRAYETIRQDAPAQIVVVGDGSERTPLVEYVRSRGLDEVRFVGFKNQSELPAYYDLCDLFVLPSDSEPWGLVVNEVMNAGKPVVVSDGVGAARDLVPHGRTGCVFPVGDIDALAGHLRALIEQPDLRRRLGANARARVAEWGLDATVAGIRSAIHALSPA